MELKINKSDKAHITTTINLNYIQQEILVKIVSVTDKCYYFANSPYAVYLSASLFTIPRNRLVGLTFGKRTLATSMSLTSTNWIALSDVAAFTNSS